MYSSGERLVEARASFPPKKLSGDSRVCQMLYGQTFCYYARDHQQRGVFNRLERNFPFTSKYIYLYTHKHSHICIDTYIHNQWRLPAFSFSLSSTLP